MKKLSQIIEEVNKKKTTLITATIAFIPILIGIVKIGLSNADLALTSYPIFTLIIMFLLFGMISLFLMMCGYLAISEMFNY